MAEFGSPVAGANTAVNPMQTLSGLLSIKQQQQNLQTGQYVQQQQQAGAQQQQQAMGERLAVQKMMQSGIDDQGNSIRADDGTPDPSKILPALGRIAPLTGQDYAQKILKSETDKVGLQSAMTSLDSQQRQMLQGVVQSGAISGAKSSDINASIDNLVQAHPEMGNAANYLKGLTPHLDQIQDPQQRAQEVNKIAARFQPGQTVQTQPAIAAINSGPTQYQGAIAPAVAGGGFTAATQVQNKPGPTQTIPYVAQAAAAGAGAAARAGGTAGSDIDRANQVSANIQPSKTAIQTTQQIDDLTDQVNSFSTGGKLAGWISEAAGALGVSPIAYARQLLNKDLGQVKALASQSAGSDQRMATILSGYPESTSAPRTIHTAMDLIRGTFRQNVARGDQLNAYRTKQPDLAGFQHADDVLTGSVDPLMSEYQSLKAPSERQGFLKRNFTSAAQAQQFVDKIRGTQHVLGP